ncbi:hypothetical protein [Mycolicibacterium houstonense]|uniref:hypothetical protein n=1 Tax=Mycolicibacterium houstonense TaxID=146021 RepID=UPI003F952EF1
MLVGELKKLKVLAAGAGGAAVVGLGVFGAVAVGTAGQGAGAMASSSHMNLGQTSTETTPPSAPEVSMAVPALRGNTPPSGFATTH